MKKISTLITLLLMCLCMSAQTSTVLFEGSKTLDWGDGVKIAGDEFKLAQAGDVVLVYTQGGGCKINLQSPWKTVTESDTELTSYIIDADDLDNLLAGGLQIQGSSTLLKVEAVLTGSEEPDEPEGDLLATLFEGSHELGNWSSTLEIEGAKFTAAGAKAGDVLCLYFTPVEGTGDGSQIQCSLNSPSWSSFWPCEDVDKDDVELSTQLTADNVAGIEADKLYIQGKNLTVTKVELRREGTTAITAVGAGTKAGGAVFSIDGRRLAAKPSHGLYIVDGKKFIAK